MSATTTSPEAWWTARDRGASNLAKAAAPSARPGSGGAFSSDAACACVPLPQRPAKQVTTTEAAPRPAPVIFRMRWFPVSAT